MSAGLLFTFDATGTGIRRAIGLLGDDEGGLFGQENPQLVWVIHNLKPKRPS